MQSFLDPNAPLVQIGDMNHLMYLIGISVILFAVFTFRKQIKEYPKQVMLGILIVAVVQRIISASYYFIVGEFTVTDSLPLHICRVVCYLIIIQFFVRKPWLDQVIFYWGILYASFVTLSEYLRHHMLGISFFMLHSLIIIYPIIRSFINGSYRQSGALQAAVTFAVYTYAAVKQCNGSNYFYTEDVSE